MNPSSRHPSRSIRFVSGLVQGLKQGTALLPLLIAGTLLNGCGQQPFIATNSVKALDAPGTFTVPAKVDILLAEDDTGSMYEAYPQIHDQMPQFLQGLEDSHWDYHFATIPLTTERSLDQIVGSRYDSNWGSEWIPPFPGASADGPGTLPANLFRTPGDYSDFLTYGDINTGSSGQEPGLDNITNTLYNLTSGTNFIRDDAMLVVLVVGNGNDTSKVNFCRRQTDGVMVPCEQVSGTVDCTDISQAGQPGQTCRSSALSFNYYKNLLSQLKPLPTMFKFYSAVSHESTYPNSCQGGYAYEGTRYEQMASALGGQYYDLCSSSNSVSQALSSLSSSLHNIRIGMRTVYLPIGEEPDPSTIVVTKSTGEVIPQDATNGWTYEGMVDGYAIDYPMQMDHFHSYAVELHGNARLVGDVSAKVTYRAAGLKNSN